MGNVEARLGRGFVAFFAEERDDFGVGRLDGVVGDSDLDAGVMRVRVVSDLEAEGVEQRAEVLVAAAGNGRGRR